MAPLSHAARAIPAELRERTVRQRSVDDVASSPSGPLGQPRAEGSGSLVRATSSGDRPKRTMLTGQSGSVTIQGVSVPSERFTGLSAVLEAIRSEEGITQPALTERVGLGRSVVAQRVSELEAAGLV